MYEARSILTAVKLWLKYGGKFNSTLGNLTLTNTTGYPAEVTLPVDALTKIINLVSTNRFSNKRSPSDEIERYLLKSSYGMDVPESAF